MADIASRRDKAVERRLEAHELARLPVEELRRLLVRTRALVAACDDRLVRLRASHSGFAGAAAQMLTLHVHARDAARAYEFAILAALRGEAPLPPPSKVRMTWWDEDNRPTSLTHSYDALHDTYHGILLLSSSTE